jgi:tRNA threonylcarbamoyladenosine biosynthesis protein TsaB
MWTLAIDTAGASGGVALGDGRSVYFAEMAGRSYSAQLVPAAARLLREAGISLSAVKLLAVVSGPGSFTGIRIGLSTAKAWAETTNAKLVTVSRLALCAASISEHDEVRVALDAGRGELFFGQYRGHGAFVLREALIKKDQLLAEPESRVPLFTFEQGVFELLSPLHPSMRSSSTAVDALAFAIRCAEAGDFADPVTLDANYLRRSDAEIFAKPDSAEAAHR